MGLAERVYSVLLVSNSGKFNTALNEMLPPSQYQPVRTAASISEAKRCTAERSYDFVFINHPLPDDNGTRFAIDCCRGQRTVVLLFVKSELFPEIYDKVVDHGVFTLSKPTSRLALAQAFSWMASARERLRRMEKKTQSFEDRMEEIRIVNRAKCLLISERKLGEPEAHHYIEKCAMDNCISKKEAAQRIIALYSGEDR